MEQCKQQAVYILWLILLPLLLAILLFSIYVYVAGARLSGD